MPLPIMSTSNSGSTGPDAKRNFYNDGLDHVAVGTSFAAPQVSGTIGLMLSLNPALTPVDIRNALRATAREFPTTGAAPDVTQCQAPGAVEQLECYCTTSTCGAGMLDAAAALGWVSPRPTARIAVDTVTLSSSNSIVVSASASQAPGLRTLSSYQWTMLSGQQYGSFLGSTTSDSATVHFAQMGTVEVQLQVTDSTGASSTTNQTLSGGPPPVTPSRSGGSASAWWVTGLLLACLILWRQGRATRTPAQ
jgi:serine protease